MVNLPKTIEIDGKQVGYLSPSQISLLMMCPRRWKYRYIDKLPDVFGIDALVGKSVHAVLEWTCNEVIENNRVPDLEEIDIVARDLFDSFLNDPKEMKNMRDEPFDKDAMSSEISELSKATWSSFLEKRFHPIRSESKVMQRIDDWTTFGILDVLYRNKFGEKAIIDWKTTKRRKYGIEREHFLQILTYANALRESGIEVKEGWLVYIIREKTPFIQWQQVVVTESARAWAKSLALSAYNLVQQGNFYPNPLAGDWLCSSRFCPYWDRCEGAPKHETLNTNVVLNSKIRDSA